MSTQTNKRWIVIEGDGETLERQRKMMQIRDSTIYCDEGKDIGGDGSGSKPTEYLIQYSCIKKHEIKFSLKL